MRDRFNSFRGANYDPNQLAKRMSGERTRFHPEAAIELRGGGRLVSLGARVLEMSSLEKSTKL